MKKNNKKILLHEIKSDGSLKEFNLELSLDSSNNIESPKLNVLKSVSKDFYDIVAEQQNRINELTDKLNSVIKYLK